MQLQEFDAVHHFVGRQHLRTKGQALDAFPEPKPMHLDEDDAMVFLALGCLLQRDFNKMMIVGEDGGLQFRRMGKVCRIDNAELSLLLCRSGLKPAPAQALRHANINVLIDVDS